MTEPNDIHVPTQEFKEYLARDVARALRQEARFAPARRRRIPFGGVLAVAAALVLAVVAGLVWGVRTGFAAASAQVVQQGAASPLQALRPAPLRRAITALACTSPAAQTTLPQGVAIVDLPAPPAKTAVFGSILGVREVPGGKVLVNDPQRHQMKLLDSTLAVVAVPLDSVQGTSSSYGMRPLPLVRYLGDSSLTTDADAGTFLLLGPTGEVIRAMASVYSVPQGNMTAMIGRQSGVDNKGRIIFQAFPSMKAGMSVEERVANISRDTALILRADMDARRVDTLAAARHGGTMALMGRADNGGGVRVTRMPVEIVDAFAVLSDGTVGIARGQDYHVDWIFPDGTKRSTAKLPFDWKRMPDEEKQRLIDSTKKQIESMPGLVVRPPDEGGSPTGGGRAFAPAGTAPQGTRVPFQYIAPPLKDIPDFYPSLRMGAVLADLDGNLWILPNTSAQSKNGELVYDVINPKGDFRRVRVPVGRSVIGFGKGGVVFLMSGDREHGFTLERTRLPK